MRPNTAGAFADGFVMRTRSLAAFLVLVLALAGLVVVNPDDSAAQTCPAGMVLLDDGETCATEGPADEPTPPPSSANCPPGLVEDSTGEYCVKPDDPNFADDDGASQDCPGSLVLDSTGEYCVDPQDPNFAEPDGEGSQDCPGSLVLDSTGEYCIEPGSEVIVEDDVPCLAGQVLDDAGEYCIDKPVEVTEDDTAANACDAGYSLGADGVTCVADGSRCPGGEILRDNGECTKSIVCDDGFVLGSDLLTCSSSACPEDELLSVDGKRCLTRESDCPDGSPRPVSGVCLVVETDASGDGSVIVRCDEADSFCQALVNKCAEERAAGLEEESADCEDPRGNCADGDSGCEAANQRIVDCATLEDPDDKQAACNALCPPLHSLQDSGECVEYLDPRHPCVSFGNVPRGVSTNEQLNQYSYLAGTGQCVTRTEFLRRLGNFEAAAGAEAEALSLLRETTAEYLSVEEQLVALVRKLETTELQVEAFRIEAAETDERRKQTEVTLGEARARLDVERRVLKDELVEFFIGGGEAALGSAMLNADTLSEYEITQRYGRSVLDDQVETIDKVETIEAETEKLRVEVEAALAAVEASLTEARSAQADLESLVADTQRLRQEQVDRRNQEAELVSDLRANKASFAQELGIFDQASREIADIISESEFLVTEIANFDGLFGPPVIPLEFGSGFGPRLHPILGYVRNHDGIDFSAGFGQPVMAVAPGIVQIASDFGGYGNTVVIDHGGGLFTLYAHQSTISAEPGDQVDRGTIIGLIGSTGLSTGPHLHFEVWVEGSIAVDPRPYFSDSTLE